MSAAAAPAVPRVVLVVDDEQVVRMVIRRFMTRTGWTVLEAESAEQALALLATAAPDLAICDLNLPGLSGAALCERITALHPALASRLVLTSGDPGSAARELQRAELDCPILGKPFSLVELERVIEGVTCIV